MAKDEHKEAMVYTTDLMAKPPSMSSFSEGKEGSRAPLVKGPEGFLVAHFGDLVKTTEFPNVVLETLTKRAGLGEGEKVAKKKKEKLGKVAKEKKAPTKKTKKVAKKKEAKKTPTKAAKEEVKEDESPEKEEDKEKSALFGPMYYKNSHFIGIRAKTGKKNQVMSFGGKSFLASKTKGQMVEMGRKICLFLEEGRSFEEAKATASAMLAS